MSGTRGFHPWHDCQLGKDAPGIVNALIEIPARSKVKYTCRSDVHPGMLFVESILYSSIVYPHDYGFIPKTLCEDKAALDVLILMQEKVVPMSLLRCKPIGAIRMVEHGINDVKIIAVCPDDPMFSHFNDVSELSEHRFKEIKAFFEDYKKNQYPEPEEEIKTLPPDERCFSPRVALSMKKRDRSVWVDEELLGADEARQIITDAMKMYLDTYPAGTTPV